MSAPIWLLDNPSKFYKWDVIFKGKNYIELKKGHTSLLVYTKSGRFHVLVDSNGETAYFEPDPVIYEKFYAVMEDIFRKEGLL